MHYCMHYSSPHAHYLLNGRQHIYTSIAFPAWNTLTFQGLASGCGTSKFQLNWHAGRTIYSMFQQTYYSIRYMLVTLQSMHVSIVQIGLIQVQSIIQEESTDTVYRNYNLEKICISCVVG